MSPTNPNPPGGVSNAPKEPAPLRWSCGELVQPDETWGQHVERCLTRDSIGVSNALVRGAGESHGRSPESFGRTLGRLEGAVCVALSYLDAGLIDKAEEVLQEALVKTWPEAITARRVLTKGECEGEQT